MPSENPAFPRSFLSWIGAWMVYSAVGIGFLQTFSHAQEPPTSPRGESSEAVSESPADAAHRTYLQLLRSEDRYPTAASCAQCHPDHYDEWSVSPHSYAMLSPVFNSMHTFITNRTSGTNGDFCIRCHTPVGMERGEPLFGSTLLRSPASVEGVSCVVCHRLDRDFGNSSGRFRLTTGDITEPVYGPAGNANLKAAIANQDLGLVTNPEEMGKHVHQDAVRSPVISTSAACAMCHDVNSPAGIRLESAFTEYKNSPASKEGTSCQDCHMSLTPGAVVSKEERYATDGRDLNYAFEPAAKVRNSPNDPRDGMPTPPRKRTNHMFIGPDYSIVHPGLFPHSIDAPDLTYGQRFRKSMADYLSKLATDPESESKKDERLMKASAEARRHSLSDWITFRWWEGWGTPAFEDHPSEAAIKKSLEGVGFPWADPKDPDGSRMRRKAARLVLARQFNLLNQAHAERTRILRRALQFKAFEISRNDQSGLRFSVDVHNVTNGHAVPTGFDAERVMFMEVTVTDANGRILFVSGDRDPNGDLRDLHSAYVHAGAEKSGEWLAASAWKSEAGLALQKSDRRWVLDPFFFSLQSHFVTGNLVGGEREQVLPINVSMDPLPYIRPATRAEIHSGRAGPARKQFRIIPPLGHRTAEYRVDRDQLTGALPYSIEMRLISQMVPVNLIKSISSVGFDYNLSAREVAQRVVHGHQVSASSKPADRRGGATTIWHVVLPAAGGPGKADLTPTEAMILRVPESSYPFPHTSEEEIEASRRALHEAGHDAGDLLLKDLDLPFPDAWPGGTPDGLPFLPDILPATP